MKKTWIIVLVVVLSVAVILTLTGCGKKPAEEPVNLFFERKKAEIKPAIIF